MKLAVKFIEAAKREGVDSKFREKVFEAVRRYREGVEGASQQVSDEEIFQEYGEKLNPKKGS